MSALSLRLPDSLHNAARELAQREHVSVNQLVTLALAEKLAALKTEDYLRTRAARGERRGFEVALSHVPDVDADEHDRL